MQRPALRQPLDGGDRPPLALHRQGEAGEHGPAVEEHRARPALPQLAAVLGAGQAHLLPENFQERVVDGGQELPVLPVHPEPQPCLVHGSASRGEI